MEKRKIAIAGSTGFIGKHLMNCFSDYEIQKIDRKNFHKDIKELAEMIEETSIVMNFVGTSIIKRWTKKNKMKIFDSRIETTSKIVRAILLSKRKIHLINASAIGIYDDELIHTEKSKSYSEGFIYELITHWEKEALKAKINDNKITILRMGIVLAKDGGLYKQLKPIFKKGLGGKIGTGTQWMSFIHIYDLVNAVKFIIGKNIEGVVNLTTPQYITNEYFTKTLARMMRKPAFLTVPVMALKLWYGEGADILFKGQRVIPERLLTNGFIFEYPNIEEALKEIIVD